MKVYLVKRKNSPSFIDKTRWLIIADNELELFWEIDKYQSPWDTKYCEIKNKSISLQFKIKEVKPEFEDDLDYEINEEGTEGLYDLVDRESSVPWREFDKEQANFYEQSFYITEIIEE
tara:strand:- start:542 stop:895 length:354 start_codon:yes stop_codon:yes gene_type:complete